MNVKTFSPCCRRKIFFSAFYLDNVYHSYDSTTNVFSNLSESKNVVNNEIVIRCNIFCLCEFQRNGFGEHYAACWSGARSRCSEEAVRQHNAINAHPDVFGSCSNYRVFTLFIKLSLAMGSSLGVSRSAFCKFDIAPR